jgi:hypothetical protein
MEQRALRNAKHLLAPVQQIAFQKKRKSNETTSVFKASFLEDFKLSRFGRSPDLSPF